MEFLSLGQEDPPESEMVTHSNSLAWKIPQTEDPGGLQSMESEKKSDMTAHTCTEPGFEANPDSVESVIE